MSTPRNFSQYSLADLEVIITRARQFELVDLCVEAQEEVKKRILALDHSTIKDRAIPTLFGPMDWKRFQGFKSLYYDAKHSQYAMYVWEDQEVLVSLADHLVPFLEAAFRE